VEPDKEEEEHQSSVPPDLVIVLPEKCRIVPTNRNITGGPWRPVPYMLLVSQNILKARNGHGLAGFIFPRKKFDFPPTFMASNIAFQLIVRVSVSHNRSSAIPPA
jgi:hypothetical protein